MKLFNDFEVVRFPEENIIFVTNGGYIYYIYESKYKWWTKYKNAGNDSITVENYQDISREELIDIMGGKFPEKETDFMRLCPPNNLCIRDMLDLLKEDFPDYMSVWEIYQSVHKFLRNSDICYKSYLAVNDLLKNCQSSYRKFDDVQFEIKQLCLKTLGRDIFKREIRIVDGHDSSSYFWIMPVRVIDLTDTDGIDNVAEMRSCEISIEENDVAQYLTPFLNKYFDGTIEANRRRVDDYWKEEDGSEHYRYKEGFEWYSTYNFYTFEAVRKMLDDIKDTILALSLGQDNEYTEELKKKRGFATYKLLYARDLNQEQIDEYNANRPTEDDTEINLIVDFYYRFIYRMEYMLKVSEEKGYDLISFMGP